MLSKAQERILRKWRERGGRIVLGASHGSKGVLGGPADQPPEGASQGAIGRPDNFACSGTAKEMRKCGHVLTSNDTGECPFMAICDEAGR